MRVVLFGSSGFIGAHVRRLLHDDVRVSLLDCPGRDRADLMAADPGPLTELLRRARPDAVVLCTGRLAGDGAELVRANTLPAAVVIQAMARTAPGARLVRLGSAAEYGVVPHGAAVTEDHPALPVSEYGVSHLAATRLVELASSQGRVDGVTLRVFNPIGPGLKEDTLLGRAAALLEAAAREGRTELTLGDLSAHRDFVDVRDVAAAVVAAVFAAGPVPRVLNVGSGRAVPARLAVGLLADAAGFRGRIVERGAGPARSASVGWMLADVRAAAAALAWKPARDLAGSVDALWAAAAAASARAAG